MFEKDYIHCQIEIIARSLSVLLFHKDTLIDIGNFDIADKNTEITEDKLLAYMLEKYLNEGKINEAENYLFNILEINPSKKLLNISLDFYNRLKSIDKETLVRLNFSEAEIEQGINDINNFNV